MISIYKENGYFKLNNVFFYENSCYSRESYRMSINYKSVCQN